MRCSVFFLVDMPLPGVASISAGLYFPSDFLFLALT